MHSNSKSIMATGLASMAFLFSQASAHLIMASPRPFGGDALDNSPLSHDGSNFPCKYNGQASFWSREGIENQMAVGEPQQLSFEGSAAHGGGSCQLALTTDLEPTASSTWQVILSIEGGCPTTGDNGSGPDTYQFEIPEGIAPGQYVFGWTWISKLAGQAEYYMNCAPVTVSGGGAKAKREVEQPLSKRQSAFPNLFVANLASINSCGVGPMVDPEFPEPGDIVQRPPGNRQYAAPTGTNCFPQGGSSSGGGSAPQPAQPSGGQQQQPTGGQQVSPTGGSFQDPTSAAGQPNPPQPTGVVGGGSSSSSSSSAIVGGSSSSSVIATPVVPTPNVPTGGTGGSPTTLQTQTSAPIGTGGSGTLPGTLPGTGVAPQPPAGTPGTGNGGGSTGGLTGACSPEGQWNCIGGTNFQRCASGMWSVSQPVAAGTGCVPGQSANFQMTASGLKIRGMKLF